MGALPLTTEQEKRKPSVSKLLDSEILTLLILFGLAILAGVILKSDSKEIISNLVSGLLGYLTKSAVTAYQSRLATPPRLEPSTSQEATKEAD